MADFDEFFPEEGEPERLRKKWDAEEQMEIPPRKCAHCGKYVAGDSFFCLYCGERVFEESGSLGRLLRFAKQGQLAWVVLAIVAFFLVLSLF